MTDAGLVVLAAFVSPFAAERATVRALFGRDEFVEVYVDVPADLARERDRKGLYAKAERGELVNLTGVDSPYEPPEQPELRLDMAALGVEEAADRIIEALEQQGLLT